MKLKLIIINGMPGTGKTTLEKRLSKDLKISSLSKDSIKEMLFDRLGVGDLAWSQSLGRVSLKMLYAGVDEQMAQGKTVIIENAFYVEYARADLGELLARHNATSIELYCYTDTETRTKRFIGRDASGERHIGHVDSTMYHLLGESSTIEKYQPLEIGAIIKVDTTDFDDAAYQKLLTAVEDFLEQD